MEAPELDAEVILLLMHILKRLLPGELRLLVNSLGCPGCQVKFKAALGLFLINREGLSAKTASAAGTTNALRVLDCRERPLPGKILQDAPVIRDYLCPDCAAHFARVLELLDRFNIADQLKPNWSGASPHPHRLRGGGRGSRGPGLSGGRRTLQRPGERIGRAGSARHRLRHRPDRLLEVLPEDFGPDVQPRVFVAAGEPARSGPSP